MTNDQKEVTARMTADADTVNPNLKPRTDGRCEFAGCDHPDAQYVITVELAQLDGKREALACRQHVALVSKALSEELRYWLREGYRLAEMDEMEEQRGAHRAAEHDRIEREGAG